MIQLVETIRISLGTAMLLGLESGNLPEEFTTAFLMTYTEDGCSANCSFCPQAVSSISSPELLSRIGWPSYDFTEVANRILKEEGLQRICIQCLNYSEVVDDVLDILRKLREVKSAKISVCIHPISRNDMERLEQAGIDNIGIAIDACTPSIFDEVKGKGRDSEYTWENHLISIKQAQEIFGKNKVTTHLIIGMGETEEEAANFLFEMKSMGVRVGLFAFTPIAGTALEDIDQPRLDSYRRIQILRNLITRDKIDRSQITFLDDGQISFNMSRMELNEMISSEWTFRVSGCPGCNRPYYNERPRGPMYNYPRPMTEDELTKALEDAGL